MSPEFVCDGRVLSMPFGLLAFDVPIFPVPPFAPDARPPGPCVNTTNAFYIGIDFIILLSI